MICPYHLLVGIPIVWNSTFADRYGSEAAAFGISGMQGLCFHVSCAFILTQTDEAVEEDWKGDERRGESLLMTFPLLACHGLRRLHEASSLAPRKRGGHNRHESSGHRLADWDQ